MVGSTLPFWGLMAFTFVLLLAPQTVFPVLATVRIALVIGAATIAAHLLDRFMRRQPVALLTRGMRIAAGLAGLAIVSVPLSYWPGGSLAFLSRSLWICATWVSSVIRKSNLMSK